MFIIQFEGGLYATALVIDAAYKLSETAKKAPTIPEVCKIILDLSTVLMASSTMFSK